MTDTEWRWADPSGQQRLVRTDELRAALAAGLVAPNTPVWRPGWKEWRPAHEVPELTTSALSAANGVVPNIPPPPLAVVAVQAAFESATGSHHVPAEEPPPPPRYVPAPTRTRTSNNPVHVPPPHPVAPVKTTRDGLGPPPAEPTVQVNPHPPESSQKLPPPPPSSKKVLTGDSEPPTRRPTGDSLPKQKIAAKTPQAPAVAPKPTAHTPAPAPAMGGLSQLVRTSSKPPPPLPRMSSKPPPPKPLPKPEDIEELSGSILLADASGSQKTNAIEELSGSMLLTEPLGMKAIERPPPAPAPAPVQPRVEPPKPSPSSEELSGSFLLDAGSTGALPLVDSESAMHAAPAYVPAPAPFGATPNERITRTSNEPSVIAPLAMPLGPASVPPPAPSPRMPTAREFTPHPPPASALDELSERVTAERVTQPTPPSPPTTGATASGPNEPHVLPTLVGVPPPPDLLARSPDSFIPPAPSPDVAPVPPAPTSRTPIPPGSPSSQRVASGSSESAAPPPPERSSVKLHDFRALSPDPRMKFLLPALGVLGLFVAIGVIGLVIGMFRKKPGDDVTASTAATESASAATSPAPIPAPTAKPAGVTTPGAVSLGAACARAGAAHVIAPRAVVQSGVEVQAVGTRLALGFASGPRAGLAVAIDPSSLAATMTVRAKAHDAIRRLVPVPGGRGIAAAADVDLPGDPLAGRRTMSGDPPFDLGLGNGGLAWSPVHSRELDVIWTLEGDAPVEAVRAAPLDASNKDAGWAIAFRRGTSIFAGAVSGGASLVPKGTLVKIDGLGPQVGSPAVAAQDGAVIVAWADRASSGDPWSLRWMRFAPGDASADAKPFTVPEGGLGEHAMSPAIAPAGQGRFVLAWTEGPVSSHQVRALTISGAGSPIGAPILVSEPGINAGQAQLAVLADGRGVIAYLASSDADPKAPYQVLATPIACP